MIKRPFLDCAGKSAPGKTDAEKWNRKMAKEIEANDPETFDYIKELGAASERQKSKVEVKQQMALVTGLQKGAGILRAANAALRKELEELRKSLGCQHEWSQGECVICGEKTETLHSCQSANGFIIYFSDERKNPLCPLHKKRAIFFEPRDEIGCYRAFCIDCVLKALYDLPIERDKEIAALNDRWETFGKRINEYLLSDSIPYRSAVRVKLQWGSRKGMGWLVNHIRVEIKKMMHELSSPSGGTGGNISAIPVKSTKGLNAGMSKQSSEDKEMG